jgi:hypothetical protein
MPLRRASHPAALSRCPMDLYVLVELALAVECSQLIVPAGCAALRSEHRVARCWSQKDEHSAPELEEPEPDQIV